MRAVGRSKPGWSAERAVGRRWQSLTVTRSLRLKCRQGALNVTTFLYLSLYFFFQFKILSPPPPPCGEGNEGGVFWFNLCINLPAQIVWCNFLMIDFLMIDCFNDWLLQTIFYDYYFTFRWNFHTVRRLQTRRHLLPWARVRFPSLAAGRHTRWGNFIY